MEHIEGKVPPSHWNYRILAHETDPEIQALFPTTVKTWLKVHEVYYTNGIPDDYTKEPIKLSGETANEIKEIIQMILKDCDKPVLWAGERFPAEYVP